MSSMSSGSGVSDPGQALRFGTLLRRTHEVYRSSPEAFLGLAAIPVGLGLLLNWTAGGLAPGAAGVGVLLLSAINLLVWAALVWAAAEAAAGRSVTVSEALRHAVQLPWWRFIGTGVLALLLLGGLLVAPVVLLRLIR